MTIRLTRRRLVLGLVAVALFGMGFAWSGLLPGISGADYQALTAPPSGPLARCTGCHGSDGKGRGQPDIPVIAGQKEQFLLSSLGDFASSKRHGAVMQVASSGMTETETRAAARYFANLPGLRSS